MDSTTIFIKARRAFLDQKPSKKKRYGKAAKAEQNYDGNPPKCKTCREFVRAEVVRVDVLQARRWMPPFCALGSFTCDPGGICDAWVGKDGVGLA